VSPIDWWVLGVWLVGIVTYGWWRGRGSQDLDGYLLADRRMKWGTIALSIMATQASAITFLATPGQAYTDGMRFVQFYFGLPIAMVVLCITAVPIFHRLHVFTAYEYLERRFDGKTRTLAAGLFLTQRGLAAGLTIFAPALILSVLLGWSLFWTNIALGALVVIYTASGGTKAVNHAHSLLICVMLGGIALAFVLAVASLPAGVSFNDALHVAGIHGRLRTLDPSFDLENRYNLWSGLIGGCFLALSYFGTDQSQVGRYLTGRSVAESRLALVTNGLVKVPMQFFILLAGAMVFACYHFIPLPAHFNPIEVRRLEASPYAEEYRTLAAEHRQASEARERHARDYLAARRAGDAAAVEASKSEVRTAQTELQAARGRVIDLMKRNDPKAQTGDTNYVFLTFILSMFPPGVIGLMLASVFAASMSSTSSELNALASTTVVDVWRRTPFGRRPPTPASGTEVGGELRPAAITDRRDVRVSVIATVFWGAFAVTFAEYANQLGSLIEAVNILGSLFYGTILGIFLTGFYLKHIGGTAVFAAALVAEVAVIACFKLTSISFLWYNVIGCLLVVSLAALFEVIFRMTRRAAVA
jgi:solute:Na+ symporter, SSS family